MTTIDLHLLTQINKHFAGKDEAYYYINGVLLETAGNTLYMVAGDGHRLVCAKQKGHDLGDDFKEIIPREFIKGFRVKEGAEADISFADGSFTFKTDDDTRQTKAIDRDFPDWRRILPAQGYQLAAAHYNPIYVKSMHDFAKAIGTNSIIAPNDLNPAIVDFKDANDIFAVIMPMRVQFNTNFPFSVHP